MMPFGWSVQDLGMISIPVVLVGLVIRTLLNRRRRASSSDATPQIAVRGIEALELELRNFDLKAAPASSMLSANERYLLEKSGLRPLRVVTGNIVYSMGTKGLFSSVTGAFSRGEMTAFTQMINDARLIAINRMLMAAAALGATEVIGVQLEMKEYADFAEVTAMGTAVVKIGEPSDVDVAVGA